MAKGAPGVMLVAERSAALGTSGKSSLALTSVGSDLPARGEPLLRWASAEDPTSMLFTLNDAIESMEQESLDVGVVSVPKAMDHARGVLRDVVIPFSRVFA